MAFGIAAFMVKRVLNASCIWPIIAGPFVTAFSINSYVKYDILQNLVKHLPAVFFPNAVSAILPIQIVAFGTLGSIAGFWMAVRYDYWRQSA